jgi:hypothetical protein
MKRLLLVISLFCTLIDCSNLTSIDENQKINVLVCINADAFFVRYPNKQYSQGVVNVFYKDLYRNNWDTMDIYTFNNYLGEISISPDKNCNLFIDSLCIQDEFNFWHLWSFDDYFDFSFSVSASMEAEIGFTQQDSSSIMFYSNPKNSDTTYSGNIFFQTPTRTNGHIKIRIKVI